MLPSECVCQERVLRDAVLAGDQAAWRALYELTYQELWGYVVWRCAGLRDVAEDVTQDTWLVAVRRLADFDPDKGRFLAWLRGIAARTMQQHLRASRRREQSLDGTEVAQPARDRDQAEVIALALAELPERYEAVLRAKYLDLQSVEQIAADRGETAKAIESLLTRARQAFRAVYERLAGLNATAKETQS